jgi:hypothetical protein
LPSCGMHGGTNDLCVEELSAGESSATRTKREIQGGIGNGKWASGNLVPQLECSSSRKHSANA